MRLRKECEHGRWEEHPIEKSGFFKLGDCPGGEFLPVDASTDLDALAAALTASEGVIWAEQGWAELNDHGIRVFDAAVAYLTLFRGVDALVGESREHETS